MTATPPLWARCCTAVMAAVCVALTTACAAPTPAAPSRYAAEIAHIDRAAARVTLKASMGQQTMRVAPGVSLDGIEAGDRVRVTFGQDVAESVITTLEVVRD